MTKPTALPSRLPRPEGERERLEAAWRAPSGWAALSAVNNTRIGLYYIVTAMLFFVLAGVLGLLIRAQLAIPGNTLLDAGTYNQVFTMHGTVMMFLFAVPMVEAVAVYLLPGMLGARDLPFPRLSAYAFWCYAIGGLGFFASLFFGVAPDGGWFMYPPLTGKEHSPGVGADFWLLGIGFIEISAIAGALELIIGILFTRAPGMHLRQMPVFAWAMLVSAFMVVFAFPAVIAGTLLLEMERAFDWPFFIAARGGDPLLWQHLFWFFGHPEVYIIFLPAAGMVSLMVPTLARTPLVGYRAVVAALVVVGVLSFALWAHHMFTAGLGGWALELVSVVSMAIALPTAVQVFAWIATLRRGSVRIAAPTLFLFGFFFIFVLGGLTGVMVAVWPFDWQVHDSHFIVAHLHYVLIGGMVFPVFAGFYYWGPLVNGHWLSERVGRWVFWLMFAGFNIAFFPMHISGLLGMPRRIYTYAEQTGWGSWNLASSLGALMFAAGVALFLLDALRTWTRASKPQGNPWQAPTLEWLPARDYGVRSIPQVHGREPLWEQPGLPDEVEQGAHWLPGSVTGGRETLVTSIVHAQPRHVLVLPGDGWPPLVAAAGTAGFFLLLTVGWVWTASACGLLAVAAMWGWMWASDRVPPIAQASVAEGVVLPLGATGRASHSWWATVVLLCVDGSIFASLAFAHIHVSMASAMCPPAGAALPDRAWTLAAGGLWLLASLAMAAAARRSTLRRRPWVLRVFVAVALAATASAMVMLWQGHAQAGLEPTAQAWSATVAALLGWQWLHMLLLAVLGVYLLARSGAGLVQTRARATLDNTALLWHYSGVQGVVLMLVVELMPGLV